MNDEAYQHSRTAARFEEYLAELGDRIGDAGRRRELEAEFRRALGTLVHHRIESSRNLLSGHHGIELVHETLTRMLHDGLESQPGSLMRLVSRVAHRLFRSRAGGGLSLDDAYELRDPVEPLALLDLEFLALEEEEEVLLRTLMDQSRETKGSGRIHLERLAQDMDTSTKGLRRRLRLLLIKLGRDLDYQEFWFHRLGEACLNLYRIVTEQELEDLLGSRLRTQRRLRGLLSRLVGYGAPSSLHPDLPHKAQRSQALRLIRHHDRRSDFTPELLAHCTHLLGTDRLALHFVDAERMRAQDDAEGALALLAEWQADQLPPRRALLLRLARARCLEKLGRIDEASDLLEVSHGASSKDPLFQYNRYVLARRAGLDQRVHTAIHELERNRMDGGQSPLLLRGIRLALDQGPE